MVITGTSVAVSQEGLQIAREYSGRVFATAGVHPHDSRNCDDTTIGELRKLAANKEIVAIGECGLDFWYKWVRQDDVRKQEQRAVFERQLAMAAEAGLPVTVHSRGTWRECLNMLKTAGIGKAVFHWYSGPLDVLKDILGAGFLVSCTPALEYSKDLRAAMAYAPLEQMMIETDTPVAFPVAGASERKPSTPQDVWRTLRALALLKARPEAEVLSLVNANARAFFGCPVL